MNEQQLAGSQQRDNPGARPERGDEGRLDRIQQILASDIDPASSVAATVTDTLHNEVIVVAPAVPRRCGQGVE